MSWKRCAARRVARCSRRRCQARRVPEIQPPGLGGDRAGPRLPRVTGLPDDQYQALVGVPVADATWGELAEPGADGVWPVCDRRWSLAAQGEVSYQDDPDVRMLALVAENRRAEASGEPLERRRMYPTGLVVKAGEHVICRYRSGRAHAGENRSALLAHREAGREQPIGRSDALAATQRDDDDTLIRGPCLAPGRRQFTDLEEVFPADAAQVITVLNQVVEPAAATRAPALTAADRLAYHQTHSGPLLAALHDWLEQQFRERTVEPNRSLGKAFPDRLKRWETLPQLLRVPAAPRASNPVERALKRLLRQRKHSLCLRQRAQRRWRQSPDQPNRHRRAGRRQCAGRSGRLPDPASRRVPPAGGGAAVELPGQPGAGVGDLAPVPRHRRLVGAAMPAQPRQLAGHPMNGGTVRARPPLQSALREALGAPSKRQNTPPTEKHGGQVTIMDPAHPLYGRTVALLRVHSARSQARLVVQLPDGRVRWIPRAVTDIDRPQPAAPPVALITVPTLLPLTRLLCAMVIAQEDSYHDPTDSSFATEAGTPADALPTPDLMDSAGPCRPPATGSLPVRLDPAEPCGGGHGGGPGESP